MNGRPFTLEEERYLIAQLTREDDRVATKALQWACERVRSGFYFTDLSKIRPTVKLCLFRQSVGARRWAVNALAEIGVGTEISAILDLVPVAERDPDLLASIVGAIYSAKPEEEAEELLSKANVPDSGLSLIAASRFSLVQKRRLVETRVPLETSDPAELRAAIVLAGTGKAPEHLFESRHTNAIALSQLNLHDTASVSKYSIWALAKQRLGFSSLQINLQDVESQVAEVRKWIFRLLFSDEYALARNLELIEVVRKDASAEVREEAAIELRNNFAPGMEKLASEWFFREGHHEARYSLLDHMAAQNERGVGYADIVTEIYRKEAPRSDQRVRIEAAAAKTPLFGELRKIDHGDEIGRLFANDNDGRTSTVVNIHQSFENSQIGSVTATGSISAETINAVQSAAGTTRELLERVLDLIANPALAAQRAEGEAIIRAVATKPNKNTWQRLLSFVNGVKGASIALGGAAAGVDGLIGQITHLTNAG